MWGTNTVSNRGASGQTNNDLSVFWRLHYTGSCVFGNLSGIYAFSTEYRGRVPILNSARRTAWHCNRPPAFCSGWSVLRQSSASVCRQPWERKKSRWSCFVKNEAAPLRLDNQCKAQIPLAENTPASQLIINSPPSPRPHANRDGAGGGEVGRVTSQVNGTIVSPFSPCWEDRVSPDSAVPNDRGKWENSSKTTDAVN